LKGVLPIETEHVDNNVAVRKMLQERSITPELLPPAEDIKKWNVNSNVFIFA
jgi:DNA-damage-inducible protein D